MRDRAAIIVRTWIIPTIAAAFANHPDLDIDEVLALCEPALAEALRTELARGAPLTALSSN